MFIDKDFRSDRPLPSDISLRNPIYRSRGIVASLFSRVAVAWGKWREEQELRRLAAEADHLPDRLREDIGLPPAPPPLILGRDPLRW
jgi:hypothetical protein